MIDDANLLVVRPEECVLPNLVWRSLDKHVGMEVEKGELGVLGVDRNSGADVAVHDDEDLHAFLCLALEQPVEPPLLTDCSWATQIQLRTEPPVVDVDDVPSHADCARDIPHVVSTIDEPLRVDLLADGSKAVESLALRPQRVLHHERDRLLELLEHLVVPGEQLHLALRVDELQLVVTCCGCFGFACDLSCLLVLVSA